MSDESGREMILESDHEQWFSMMEYDAVKEIKKANGEDYAPTLDESQKNLLQQHHANLKTGLFAQTPMKCPGASACSYASGCPLAQMSKEPEGDPCPIEKEMYISNVKMYMNQFNVDPVKNYSQYKLILDLARQEVYQKRVIELLSDPDEGGVLREYIIGIDQEGRPISSEDINKLFTLLDRVDNKIYKLQKMLVATPEAEYKREAALNLATNDEGAAKSLSRIKQNTERLLRKIVKEERRAETVIDIEKDDG